MSKAERRNRWLQNHRWKGGDLEAAPSILASDHNTAAAPHQSLPMLQHTPAPTISLKTPALDLISPEARKKAKAEREQQETKTATTVTEPPPLEIPQEAQPLQTAALLIEPPPLEPEPQPIAIELPKPAGEDEMIAPVEAAEEPAAVADEIETTVLLARHRFITISKDHEFEKLQIEDTIGYKVSTHRVERDMNEKELAEAVKKAAVARPENIDYKEIQAWERNQKIIPYKYIEPLIQTLITDNDNVLDKQKATKEFLEAYERSLKPSAKKSDNNIGAIISELRLRGDEGMNERTLAESINRAPNIPIEEPLSSINADLMIRIQLGQHIPSKGLMLGIIKGLNSKKQMSFNEAQDLMTAFENTGGTVNYSTKLKRSTHSVQVVDHSSELEALRMEITEMLGGRSCTEIARLTQIPSGQVQRLLGTEQKFLTDMSVTKIHEYITTIGKNAKKLGVTEPSKQEVLNHKLEHLMYMICELRGTPLEGEPEIIKARRAAAIAAAPAPATSVSSAPAAATPEPEPSVPDSKPAAAPAAPTASEPAPAAPVPTPAPAVDKKYSPPIPIPEVGEHASIIKRVNAVVNAYNPKALKDATDEQLTETRKIFAELFLIKTPAISIASLSSVMTDYKQTDIRFTFEGNRGMSDKTAIPTDQFNADRIAKLCSEFTTIFKSRTPYDDNLDSAFGRVCDHLQELIKRKRELQPQRSQQHS